MEREEVRKVKLYFYAGLSCIGFLGAALFFQKSQEEKEEERLNKEVKKSVKQHLRDCVRVLSDPRFLLVGCVNSSCFSIMLYLVSLAPDIYKCKFREAAQDQDMSENIKILKSIFIATNALGYLLFGFSGELWCGSA